MAQSMAASSPSLLRGAPATSNVPQRHLRLPIIATMQHPLTSASPSRGLVANTTSRSSSSPFSSTAASSADKRHSTVVVASTGGGAGGGEVVAEAVRIQSDERAEEVAELARAVSNKFFLPVRGAHFSGGSRDNLKVTVVGVGNVGMACAQTILTEDVADEIALVDVNEDKLRGEMLDLQHGAAFIPPTKIVASNDYAVSAGSDLCIVTAGARQKEGESRLSLVGRNVSLLKLIIPQLVKYSPNAILLIVSNPVDILTWASWKISGLPTNRVVGTGTNLDSSRFRFLLADALNVSAQSVQAFIVGEHGDSSVPLWSSASIGGVPMLDFFEANDIPVKQSDLNQIHRRVVDGAYEVIKLKGYTSWAIGYSVASLAQSILRDKRTIQPLSVLAQGVYGIEEEVFTSLPCLLGKEGVLGIANSTFSEKEVAQLRESCSLLWGIQKELGL